MKDLTDYFCVPNKNNAITNSEQITDTEMFLIKCKTEKNSNTRKTEKRKLDLSSESGTNQCEESCTNFKGELKTNFKTKKFESKSDISNNLSICLRKVDDHFLFKNKKEENNEKAKVRHLKNVLVEDCFNFMNKSALKEQSCIKINVPDRLNKNNISYKKKKSLKSKKQSNKGIDSSDSNDSSSSDSIFEGNKRKKNWDNLVTSVPRLDENNLFNYFCKSDKNAIINESPVKCSETIKVVALVHSPPKTQIEFSNEIKENRSPVVKLVRSDNLRFRKFNDIKVLNTDIDFSDVEKKNIVSSLKNEDNNFSSSTFTSAQSDVQPWKMRVRFMSSKNLIPTKKLKSENKRKNVKKTETKIEENIQKNTANLETTNSIDEKIEFKPLQLMCLKNISKLNLSSQINSTDTELKNDTKKLAPLFYKQYEHKKKPVIATDDEAKKLFLESGVPEILKKKLKQEEQKNFTEDYLEKYKFPILNHVQQKDFTQFVWNLTNVSEDLKIKSPDDEIIIKKSDVICKLISNEINDLPSITSINNLCNFENFDLNDELTNLKKIEPDVSVEDILSSVKTLKKNAEYDSSTICWTDKYKPNEYKDLIGNANSLLKLKEWIESQKRVESFMEAGNTSSEEFIDSDDSNSSMIVRSNVAMLVGPPGCGKTSAVYMLANELGFKVLEVNAASNRNGKRLLGELLEATQSHRVKRTILFTKDSKKLIKKKRKTKQEKKMMSLILIEDADIIFENYDEGFLTALSSLASQSKRPLIFTMNDLHCPHLSKYNNTENLILKFTYPSGSLLNVWLNAIAFTEGVKLSDEILIHLFHEAGLDFRKNLLQLQLLISSNKTFSKLNGEQIFYIDWWRTINITNNCHMVTEQKAKNKLYDIFSDDEDYSTESNAKDYKLISIKEKSKSEREIDLKTLLECSNFFETIALLGVFKFNSTEEKMIFPDEELYATSFSSFHSQLNSDITDYIKNHIFHKFQKTDSSFSFKEYYNKIRQSTEIKHIHKNIFNYYNPPLMDNLSKSCDYLPIIRDIARMERNKFVGNIRKSNRYFSYLKSVNIDVSDKVTDILCNSLI